MKCPVCNSLLIVKVRQKVEIDFCPLCRGVWLDRGELDNLLESARRGDDAERDHNDEDKPEHSHPNPKRRESFWSELFDFE